MGLNETAFKEKNHAALTSVIAAIGLTAFKIVVGVITHSLGILAEAAHSSLDLVAALVTLFAVRKSGKPADKEHSYGHGKIENLSALFETLLLLATSVWIIYEAVRRLIFNNVEVEVNAWAFIVMAVSIIIDASRSRVLYNAAKKYNSQALEADALHFSTDIWSSSVVILGLIGVLISNKFPAFRWLHQADAVAAIGVALIVIFVSYNLGKRTIEGLMDTAPNGIDEKINAKVSSIAGVLNCHQIRVRTAGAESFVDVHILVDGNLSLAEAHKITEIVENEIKELLPGADVTVHPESPGEEGLATIKEDASSEKQVN